MATLSPAERSYIIDGLASASATREDGRGLRDPRPMGISYGDAPAANGSARVRVGNTEVVGGIKLEVVECALSPEAWRAKVEVDVTPQAYPSLTSNAMSTMSATYASFLSDYFLPCVPALPITSTKYFTPTLHLTVLSADGNVCSALVIAARAAFSDLRVPVTKNVGVESTEAEAAMGQDLAGIKGAIAAGKGGKGRAKARARGGDDWDIDGTTDTLKERENLPVPVTLNLVPDSSAVFIDATPREEAACSSRIHALFRPDGRICGLRTEGDKGIDVARIRPLLEDAKSVALKLAQALNADLP